MTSQAISRNRLPDSVLLATTDSDLGLVQGYDAIRFAKQYADTFRQTVYVRDPVSDAVLRAVRPQISNA